ncbi:MAG: cyclic nucleotide-binding domain-containing protein [Nitrospinales bacterium]
MNSQDVEWLKGVFNKTKMFSNLSEKETVEVIDRMERVNFSKGDIIFKEGDQGDWFFIVREGKVNVIKQRKWLRDKVISELGPEDFFGELALYTNNTRSATLMASEDAVCFVLFKNKFKEQTEKHPAFKSEIEKLIESRNIDKA